MASYATGVRVLTNGTNLYVSAIMQRNPDASYATTTLRDDYDFFQSDAFGIIIDPFSDVTNGYGFYSNAYGARRDEQIFNGNTADAAMDIKWRAETIRQKDYWSLEMEIPLKYIRHGDAASWNINFVRNDVGANEKSSWVRTPINFILGNLSFHGKMNWAQAPGKGSRQYQVIPGITFSKSRETDRSSGYKLQPSLDAKIPVSSSMNLDLTINPDFSQADADAVHVNLTRFELSFPENRLFFTENADLFSAFGADNWGSPSLRPFYSRRIGLRFDSASQSYTPAGIIGGMRLSGKLNKDLRLGLLSVLTKSEAIKNDDKLSYSPAENYSVVALQQKVFGRSNIAFLFANRQLLGTDSSRKMELNRKDFSRVAALEYNYSTADNKLSGKVFYHLLFDDKKTGTDYAAGMTLFHNTHRWRNWVQVSQISPGFKPATGFVPRTDVLGINLQAAYSIYPKKGKTNRIEFVTNPQFFNRGNGKGADQYIISGLDIVGRNTSDWWIVHIYERVNLRADFDPAFNKNGNKLDSGKVYGYHYGYSYFNSDKRKPFSWDLGITAGQYYNGTQLRATGSFTYRMQPWTSIGINYNVCRFNMPKPFSSNSIYYVGPKVEASFNRSLFLTTSLQYSSLSKNLVLYSRLQWRFRPLSDIYLVYTSNKDVQMGQMNNENLILKMNWCF